MILFSKQGKPCAVRTVFWLQIPSNRSETPFHRGSSAAGTGTSPGHILLQQKEMLSRQHIYYQFGENENTQETIISILQQKIGFSGE